MGYHAAMRVIAGAIVVFLVTVGAGAHADVPPEPGYVEQCTVERHQGPTATCTSCSAWHGERDKCDKEWAAQGYTKRCQSRGASTWSEVWCKGEAAVVQQPPQKKAGACAVSPGGAAGAGGAAVVTLALLGLALSRRHRRR
jgi:MYXO-CTERM domain-containing protein